MSTCARCGRPVGDDGGDECAVSVSGDECEGALMPATIACRDRELANLHSLLRSVTGELEEAGGAIKRIREGLDGSDRIQWDLQQEADLALRQLDAVLEALS